MGGDEHLFGGVTMVGAIFKAIALFFHPVKWIDEFLKRFPGRCPVCSFHRYGLREGFVRPGEKPAPHKCAERWGTK
jgi:hypothetical protein